MKNLKTRAHYFAMFVILTLAEVLIALYVHDSIVRPYIGDIIVVPVCYCFVRTLVPTGVRLMPLYVFLFASFLELLQLFHIVKLLRLEHNRVLSIALGSTFDIKDIACYFVGLLMIFFVKKLGLLKARTK